MSSISICRVSANTSRAIRCSSTGGAGSIGFELVNQILKYQAKLVVIFDINENKLFRNRNRAQPEVSQVAVVTCIGSIQDRARFGKFSISISRKSSSMPRRISTCQ